MDWQLAKKGFKNYLKLERSLAKHSIEAYLRDIDKICQFLEANQNPLLPLQVQTKNLKDMLVWVNNLGMLATTQARLISGIKAFYKYLVMEDFLKQSPDHQ